MFICLLCNKCATIDHINSQRHKNRLRWPDGWVDYWQSYRGGGLRHQPPQPQQQQHPTPPPPPASAAATPASPPQPHLPRQQQASTAASAATPEQAHPEIDALLWEARRINGCRIGALFREVLGLFQTDQSEQAVKTKYRELTRMLHADKRQWLMGDPKEEFDQAYLKVHEKSPSGSATMAWSCGRW